MGEGRVFRSLHARTCNTSGEGVGGRSCTCGLPISGNRRAAVSSPDTQARMFAPASNGAVLFCFSSSPSPNVEMLNLDSGRKVWCADPESYCLFFPSLPQLSTRGPISRESFVRSRMPPPIFLIIGTLLWQKLQQKQNDLNVFKFVARHRQGARPWPLGV